MKRFMLLYVGQAASPNASHEAGQNGSTGSETSWLTGDRRWLMDLWCMEMGRPVARQRI
jgi:hypothetical protein